LGTEPPWDFAVADWIRDAAAFDIDLDILVSLIVIKIVPAGTFVILNTRKRQMGTKQESIELQAQIKKLIVELGWSQNRLARILYTELNEWDDEDEIAKFQEKLKKELQRTTTKVERLRIYLDVIFRHPEAQKLDVVLNKYIPQNSISSSLSEAMADISQEIDNAYNKALHRTSR